jgi:S-adenosylmethionine hydrolase
MSRIITLTTDFGEGSSYVAQMKGEMLAVAPQATLIDLSHKIAPQNVREGAIFLAEVLPRFPASALHLAVVDPGVGTQRKILVATWRKGAVIGPDNGLFSILFQKQPPDQIYHLNHSAFGEPTPTFHGRDLMAPAIAKIAQGSNPLDLGVLTTNFVTIELPIAVQTVHGWRGEVISIDSFGNLITNIPGDRLKATSLVQFAGAQIEGLKRTYGDAEPGQLIALIDSQNRLEIAQVNGNAAKKTGLQVGDVVSAQTPDASPQT